jgi:phosphopantothenoylcysteine decarboxylase/phosphopantothenate--cysteine ligase
VKIKREGRNEDVFTLSLQSTADIAADLGTGKKPHQILAGFALETDHEENNAIQKMIRKKLDFIVLNSLRDPGAGFQYDTNRITLIDSKGEIRKFELKRKEEVAEDIADKLATYC